MYSILLFSRKLVFPASSLILTRLYVGSGVVEVIDKNNDMVSKKAGDKIEVKYILDLRDFPGDPNEGKVVHDFETIINDPEISVICETMGGINPEQNFSWLRIGFH